MVNDPIADMFIRIKNAQAVNHASVTMPASKMKESIASVLKKSGYIGNVARKSNEPGDLLEIELRYEGKQPVISHLKRISKPGSRRYSSVESFPRPLSGHGLVIVSTSKGVMSGAEAQKAGLGGEVIATVW
jgi:small subunit ribosomal protein S8